MKLLITTIALLGAFTVWALLALAKQNLVTRHILLTPFDITTVSEPFRF